MTEKDPGGLSPLFNIAVDMFMVFLLLMVPLGIVKLWELLFR